MACRNVHSKAISSILFKGYWNAGFKQWPQLNVSSISCLYRL